MKWTGSIAAAVFSALIAMGAFVYAQNPHAQKQKEEHSQARQRQDQGKHVGQQKQEQRAQQQRQRDEHPQQRAQQMRRSPQQQHEHQAQQRESWNRYRARHWESQHRTWRQRGGYNGYRFPAAYFRSHYGRAHWFRVYNLPFMMRNGYPSFQYAGYWFMVLDPYPEYWGPSWYRTDDVYIDYVGDGYYLFNRRYPGRAGIAVSIWF